MKNKGFSLVELIVVIAIMAILVGVAVPVYTSYIDKANKSKDEQLVDEIKHAMQIAAIGDEWFETMPNGGVVGTVVISDDRTTVSGDNAALIDAAMKATFGNSYANDITLSYDGWTGTLNTGGVNIIVGSAYAENPKQLLGTVQDVTDLFKLFIDANGDGIVDDGVSVNVDEEYFSDLGISPNNSQHLANGMVSYVADTALTIEEQAFVDAWVDTYDSIASKFGTVFEDVFARKAAEYAFVEAMCTYADAAGCTTEVSLREKFNAYNAAWEGANPIADVYSAHCDECTNCNDAVGIDADMVINDAKAYLKLMEQVSQSKDIVSSNINSENMYTESSLAEYVTAYVSVADLLSGSSAKDGDVVLVVTMDAYGKLVVHAYPLDY